MMFKRLEDIKSLFGLGDNSIEIENAKSDSTYSKGAIEESIKKEEREEKFICDCCKETEITVKISDLYKIDENGNKMALYAHPKVTSEKGSMYNDVVICDNCFAEAQTDVQRQFIWLAGKMNQLDSTISEKEASKLSMANEIETITAEANAKIQEINARINNVNAEIHQVKMAIEQYAQEQERLESLL